MASPKPLYQVNLAGRLSQKVLRQAQALERAAGPQLNPNQPPWHLPGGHVEPTWPGRAFDFCIPLDLPLSHVPDRQTNDQAVVNTFLTALDEAIANRSSVAGPSVVLREVSTRSPGSREREIENSRRQGPGNQRIVGIAPHAMRLQDYSLAATEVVNSRQFHLARGTLVLMAAQDAPSALATHTAFRRFSAHATDLQPGELQRLLDNPVAQTQDAVWHNTGLFIQARQDYPRRNQAVASASFGSGPDPANEWRCWTFDGSWRRCYVYDPSYINETAPAERVTKSLENGFSRLQDHLFLRTTYYFLNEVLGPQRATWLFTPGTTFIGGGGNIAPLEQCRRMSCVWMQQVGWLSGNLNSTIADFQRNPSRPTLAAFQAAEDEFQRFFSSYTALRR